MASVRCLTLLVLINACMFVTSQDTSVEEAVATSDDQSGVQEIVVPMCRNLIPYNITKLPVTVGRETYETQAEVYGAIQHMWAYMDHHCSLNFRLLVCATYLPKYDPQTMETQGPCKLTCSKARRGCIKTMRDTRSRWPRQFRCNRYPRRNCIRPVRELQGDVVYPYVIENRVPLCSSVPYLQSFLPNFFLQYDTDVITRELHNYDELIAGNCNPNLLFFLCGTYIPFYTGGQVKTPCQELCQEVLTDCETAYSALYRGIPWPNKLQCHRYHLSTSNRTCAMPGDEHV